MTNQFSDNSDVVWPDKPKVEKDIYKHKANCNQISELGTCPYAQEMSNGESNKICNCCPCKRRECAYDI